MEVISLLLTMIKLCLESAGIIAVMMLIYALFAPRTGKRVKR